MKPKPSVYINPNAPEGFRNVMRELFPTGNEVSAEEMQRKLDAELRRMSDRDLAEVFEAALRSHDADGIQALGTELLGRGADKAKE